MVVEFEDTKKLRGNIHVKKLLEEGAQINLWRIIESFSSATNLLIVKKQKRYVPENLMHYYYQNQKSYCENKNQTILCQSELNKLLNLIYL